MDRKAFRSASPAGLERDALDVRMDLARRLGGDAAKLILTFYRSSGLAVEKKDDGSPVTEADRRTEEILRAKILEQFPEDTVLGEELGESGSLDDRGYRWILDPIDGTESFSRGVPLFGTLIGIERQGTAVGGVIVLPALGELLFAARDQGTWLVRGDVSPQRVRVSEVPALSDSMVLSTTGAGWEQVGQRSAQIEIEKRAAKSRGWGDCYGYVLVATGRAEAMLDPLMHVWDNAAIQPVIEEAGGIFTDWDGVPTIFSPNAIATNGWIHEEMLRLLRS